MIPAIEDLDPAYIASSRSRAPASFAENSAVPAARTRADRSETAADPEDQTGTSIAAARKNRSAGVNPRRASVADPELELPLAESTIKRDRAPSRSGRSLNDEDTQDDQPETRTVARPRSTGSAPPRRPAYKVRPYDTLRSIARDTLGDSRRADEILDLNREIIDDPAQLVVGQLLELPEDARTSLRRSARSR